MWKSIQIAGLPLKNPWLTQPYTRYLVKDFQLHLYNKIVPNNEYFSIHDAVSFVFQL